MTKARTFLCVAPVVALMAACVPAGSSDHPVAEWQREVDGHVAALPWPAGDHADFVVQSAQDANVPRAYAISDCPSRTVRIFPSAFLDGADIRWIVAHEAGHQRDCDGLPQEFYDLVASANPPIGLYEGLANCLAKSWIGYTGAGAWDCPDEIVARVPEFAPN